MGKRCRVAALGATFALLVAACAATDPEDNPQAVRAATTTTSTSVAPVQFPDSLADASFVRAELPSGPCVAGDDAQVALFDAADGQELWSFTIPRPGGLTVLNGNAAFLSFAWDREQSPGVGAIDLEGRAPLWQRFLDELPEQMERAGDGLVVVTRSAIRSLDPADGSDNWVIGTEFDFTDVVIEDNVAYVLNSVGVNGIDLTSGRRQWQFPIERPDGLAAADGLVVIASGSRIAAVDVEAEALIWDDRVNRLGAGEVWVSRSAVLVELAPAESPAGGILAIDAATGIERWQLDEVDEIFWTGADQIVTSTAAPEFRGSEAWDLFAIDVASGERQWSMPVSAPASHSVVGVADGRAVVVDPHPAVAGVSRIRLIDTADGSVVWETSSVEAIDGASIEVGSFVEPWVMRPFAVPVIGELWLASLIKPVFYRLMAMQGIYDIASVPRVEVEAYVDLLKRGDGGRAFLDIMRRYETTAKKERLYLETLKNRSYPAQVIWGEHDPALKIGRYGTEAQRSVGVDTIHRVPGRHFLQEDNAPAIADLVAALASSAGS